MPDNGVTVLAIDISSGGVSATLFSPDLHPIRRARVDWRFVAEPTGRETLSAVFAWEQLREAIRSCVSDQSPPEAITLSSMMHTLVLAGEDGLALTPVYTWMDSDRPGFVDEVEARLGRDYTLRTGAYFHPSFPAFKLARLRVESPEVLSGTRRILSIKAYLGARLTGNWAEDVSTASSSGLLNLHTGRWDERTLETLGIDERLLPTIIQPTDPIGGLAASAAGVIGLPAGLPVIAGGGDGFLATVGSGCEAPDRTSITVGTTATVRRFAPMPTVGDRRGTFCYRYAPNRFLVGAASNNGGNVLDWANQAFGVSAFVSGQTSEEVPLFLPHLRGERTPFWDSRKHARWILPASGASVDVLGRSVVEGVAFQLGNYYDRITEILEQVSETVVLSGNGFQTTELGAILAAIIPAPVIEPLGAGLATLRGAARCGFQALGIATQEATEALLASARTIERDPDPGLDHRYARFTAAYTDGEPVSQ